MSIKPEILAPAGSFESLVAAVRSGADAVYLGGKDLNARRNAGNFDNDELARAVQYCKLHGVKVYLTLNTIVFDNEFQVLYNTIETACKLGIDAVIAEDLATARFVRDCANDLELHASTQMAVHNADGAKILEQLGFSRVVLARELSKKELIQIKSKTKLDVEIFVHGAHCMCISGQCYISAMIGGRSGNRGLCAQPCRLPFASPRSASCLSLKDLSLIDSLDELCEIGIASFKIEGRMKRPEYVAAAVTAIKNNLNDKPYDIDTLRSVFSRDGFCDGYYKAKLGNDMFGTRRREDVVAANPALLSNIAATYRNEVSDVPVSMQLKIKANMPSELIATDDLGNTATATADIPEAALTAPTSHEKALQSLSKTGGTAFYIADLTCDIGDGLMLRASSLNQLRRDALAELALIRQTLRPHVLHKIVCDWDIAQNRLQKPTQRVKISNIDQLTEAVTASAQFIIVPAAVLGGIAKDVVTKLKDRIIVESPRILFGEDNTQKFEAMLRLASDNGITKMTVGNLGHIEIARRNMLDMYGDYGLNIVNSCALEEYERLGISDVTLSFELNKKQIESLKGTVTRGILSYGRLPLMVTRNCPIGDCKGCDKPSIKDRLGNVFPVRCGFGVSEVLNCVPLSLSDRLNEFRGIDFHTIVFTDESPQDCDDIINQFKLGLEPADGKTRGLYYRGVE